MGSDPSLPAGDPPPAELALIAAIADALPVGVWVARAPDGAFVYANRAFQEIMGMGPRSDAQVGGYSAPYSLHARDGSLYREEDLPFVRALQKKASVVVDDIVVHRPDGRRVFVRAFAQPMVDAAGTVTNITVAFTDITDEVQAHAQRVEAEQRLRNVLAHVPLILFAFDRSGVVTFSEGLGLENVGWRAEDFIGHSVFDLYKDQPQVLENCRRALAGEAFTHTTELGPVLLETMFTPMRDGAGEVVAVTGVSINITERRKMQMRLMEAERLASMGTMAATVAHEINNPMTYMMANLDMLARRLAEAEPILPQVLRGSSAFVTEAQEGLDRIRIIVRGLKAFSRQSDEPSVPTEVRGVLEQSIAMTENEMGHRARLVTEFSPVPRVRANAVRLSQVFVNLLINAAHAIPEGHREEHEIRVRTGMDASGTMVVISIEDTGSGIPREIREHIFEPFFTTKPVGVGTGLGLSICHGILSGFGGSIDVESEPGRGSIFRVRLPVEERASTAAPSEAAKEGRGVRSRGRLLIVDDDGNVARTLGMLLDEEHDVEVSTHPRRALELLLGGTRFDVIFCDLMMPEMTGMELYEAVAEKVPEQAERIVFMTGGAFTASAQDFLSRVPNDRLEKPFGKAELDKITRNRMAIASSVVGR